MRQAASGVPLAETRVKLGDRVVGDDKELVEKLGNRDACPVARGDGLRSADETAATFDGVNRHYYRRD